ncbi:hypothetical protein [Flavobacterium sp. 245]|uniref:hypothetical protein n=1 Tax=Flavobacterium sp. 245 TaxID=2512115 RepID=UPI00105C21F4|nr:hypothetical protein [Flavobacterium sp. 245]TDP03093.1 hypothetical protein EV145_102255 [Flavobacterium sp. 245]
MIKYNTISVDTDLNNLLSSYRRANPDTESALRNGIENLSNFNTINGYHFDSLTYLAINYFYDNIFVYYDAENKKHSYKANGTTTIASIKGYFDACNYTQYIPIYTIDKTDYKQLFNAELFMESYLIIQTAYFFGSKMFGQHQYIKVVEYYRLHGIILPNDLDKTQLTRAFTKIDTFKNWNGEGVKPSNFSKDNYLNNWYYGTLDLIANTLISLGHNCINFKYEFPIKKGKVSEYRIYNKLIQTPRILRKVQPFEMIEFDIKSGHLSYIDLLVGSNVSKTAYDNYAKAHGITRDEAKRKFQSILNWREFRKSPAKQKQYHTDLCGFGWTPKQATRIIKEVTDASEYLFGHFASKFELKYTDIFIKVNKIKGSTRGHDAVYLLKRRDVNYSQLITSFENGIIQFELKPTEQHKTNFEIETRQYNTPKAIYFNGITNKRVAIKYEIGKIPDIVLIFTDYVEVVWRAETEREERFSVYVGINYHKEKFSYYAPKIDTEKPIFNEIKNAYNTLLVLNDYTLEADVTHVFCQHIRKYLNFDIVSYSRLLQAETATDFVPVIRQTRITTIYNENKTDDIDFNNMLAQNTATGLCTDFWMFEKFKNLLKRWIIGQYKIDRKPKGGQYYNLRLKMFEIDKAGRKTINSKTLTLDAEPSSIIKSIIIEQSLAGKMLFCPKIDKKQTKERQAKQLAKQIKDWHKLDLIRTEQMRLTKEAVSEIIDLFKIESKYNINYVSKYN